MNIEENYKHILEYLYERLPMFSRIGKAALKPNLSNTIALCAALGNPQVKFKSIHIAGTNGKGSTSHSLAAIFQDAGYKTGLYTSPHLIDFRERIRINGVMLSQRVVIEFVEMHKQLIENIKPSFFEITVAMAFEAFANENVDIAIIETGLGGRLDSTNIITPVLSIITNISYDHKDLLGNTLAQIASEKAGIIKSHVPVIIGEKNEETDSVFIAHAQQKNSDLYFAEALWDVVSNESDSHFQYIKVHNEKRGQTYEIKTDLLGNYQQHNTKTVLTAAELLIEQGYDFSLDSVIHSLSKIKATTGLMGRWDRLSERPIIICDVAHNPAGLSEVMRQWHHVKAINKHIVVGFVKDKDVIEALQLFPKDAIYYFCNAHLPRALPAIELKEMAHTLGLNGNDYTSVGDAVKSALRNMDQCDALLIVGSFFIVGEAMEYLQQSINK